MNMILTTRLSIFNSPKRPIRWDIRTHIDDFNDVFQTELKAESVDTIGGVMIDHFGKVPKKDDFFVHLGLKISILDADDRRVYRVHVDKP